METGGGRADSKSRNSLEILDAVSQSWTSNPLTTDVGTWKAGLGPG